ncbi:retrovirus-related pol polyprotein from transposon TNT 1-94 [Tanacetum coccineum]|uniref:Retrovirus-related pol polyprotein from transposon TNT 1-94 n=1 Tax=Tanacetum coccineum TaxID=301880 RepID=A0ABQ4X1B6_9ASTR
MSLVIPSQDKRFLKQAIKPRPQQTLGEPKFQTLQLDCFPMARSSQCDLKRILRGGTWTQTNSSKHQFGTQISIDEHDEVFSDMLAVQSFQVQSQEDHLFAQPVNWKNQESPQPNQKIQIWGKDLQTLTWICVDPKKQSIKGKKYILVIVDDYSRFTWVTFLRSKDETPEFVINFLKQMQVGLNKTAEFINGNEFIKQVNLTYNKHRQDGPVSPDFRTRAIQHDPWTTQSGLAPSDKELRMYFTQLTSLSTPLIKDAPSSSASIVDIRNHHPVQHQEMAENPLTKTPQST